MIPLEEANKVLQTFAPSLTFIRRHNRLCLKYKRESLKPFGYSLGTTKTIEAQVAKHSGALCINYGKLGMGGTMAMAVGQLARWIRGQSRVPISAWEYWASDKILLARDRGNLMLQYIKESSYDDGKATRCVLCGDNRCGDWWSLNGVVGPCCTFGRCKKEKRDE
jgi:hypothetical protein